MTTSLDIAKEKGVESVYAIMLQDNYRALSLTKKMGFNIEYLSDGTVKATLNLKNENVGSRCLITNVPEPLQEPIKQPKTAKTEGASSGDAGAQKRKA